MKKRVNPETGKKEFKLDGDVNAAGTVVFEATLSATSATTITFNVTTASPSSDAYPAFLEVWG